MLKIDPALGLFYFAFLLQLDTLVLMNVERPAYNLSSIIVSEFSDESVEKDFLVDIDNSYNDLRKLLPNLHAHMKVYFGTSYEYGETGVTGSAIDGESMQIGIDPDDRVDRDAQHARIREVVFHEGYHVAQGFHRGTIFSALDSAIYEGCATVFERDYAGSKPKWGNYQDEGEEVLGRWYEAIKMITAEQYFEPSGETWQKWAFYDNETQESWRIYKVGTWIIDDVMAKTDMSALELNGLTADQILSIWNN